jgi:hypothetical protein
MRNMPRYRIPIRAAEAAIRDCVSAIPTTIVMAETAAIEEELK